MPRYYVTLPIAGYLGVEVEANNEEQAIETAIMSDISVDDIMEWDTYRQLVNGNVCYVSPNRAYAELIEEDEE